MAEEKKTIDQQYQEFRSEKAKKKAELKVKEAEEILLSDRKKKEGIRICSEIEKLRKTIKPIDKEIFELVEKAFWDNYLSFTRNAKREFKTEKKFIRQRSFQKLLRSSEGELKKLLEKYLFLRCCLKIPESILRTERKIHFLLALKKNKTWLEELSYLNLLYEQKIREGQRITIMTIDGKKKEVYLLDPVSDGKIEYIYLKPVSLEPFEKHECEWIPFFEEFEEEEENHKIKPHIKKCSICGSVKFSPSFLQLTSCNNQKFIEFLFDLEREIEKLGIEKGLTAIWLGFGYSQEAIAKELLGIKQSRVSKIAKDSDVNKLKIKIESLWSN